MRLYTYDEPLERDIAFYALTANELAHGRYLYSDLWEHYPPAISTTYLVAQHLAGYGPSSIYLLGVSAALITLGGIYRAAAVSDGPPAGLLAAGLWTLISSDLRLQANQPNAEVFINACLIWAFALLVRNDERSLSPTRCGIVGGLLGLAILYKPVAIAPAVALAVAHWALPSDAAQDRCRAVRQVMMIAVASISLGLAVFLYFVLTARAFDFWDHVVLFSLSWAGNPIQNLTAALKPQFLFHNSLLAALPMSVLASLGLMLAKWKPPSRTTLLLLAYGVSVEVAILLPGKFYDHYYQFWLPVLCVASAWAVARIHDVAARNGPFLSRMASALALGVLAALQAPSYMVRPEEWPIRKYGSYGTIFVDARRAGEFIREILLPDEGFYQWGKETGLYFYSRRRLVTGVSFLEPLWAGPLKTKLVERMLADLDRRPPELFVVHPDYDTPQDHPVLQWFYNNQYAALPLDSRASPFRLYYRRGGSLHARLSGIDSSRSAHGGALDP